MCISLLSSIKNSVIPEIFFNILGIEKKTNFLNLKEEKVLLELSEEQEIKNQESIERVKNEMEEFFKKNHYFYDSKINKNLIKEGLYYDKPSGLFATIKYMYNDGIEKYLIMGGFTFFVRDGIENYVRYKVPLEYIDEHMELINSIEKLEEYAYLYMFDYTVTKIKDGLTYAYESLKQLELKFETYDILCNFLYRSSKLEKFDIIYLGLEKEKEINQGDFKRWNDFKLQNIGKIK